MEQTKHLFRSSRTRQWPLKVRIKRGERFHPFGAILRPVCTLFREEQQEPGTLCSEAELLKLGKAELHIASGYLHNVLNIL